MAGTPPAAGHGGAERATRHRTHWVAVGVLTALTAVGYSVFSLARYYTFPTWSYDLVIFDQAVRSYAHFQPGISIIKGLHNGFGPHFSVLGDHWSPILASLAPLYWIYDSPQTLLVAQAVLFALAIPPLWVFTRRAFGGGREGDRRRLPGFRGVPAELADRARRLAFDFHEVAFAPVLTAVALERLQAGRLRTALIALAALLLVKEDMGLLVAGIGVYLAVARPRLVPRQRLVALALIVGGVADTVLATYVLIPAFGGACRLLLGVRRARPRRAPGRRCTPDHPPSSARCGCSSRRGSSWTPCSGCFGAFCFLPLLSPISLAVIPLLLERMLRTSVPNWWITAYQYNAYLVIVLVCAAVDGAPGSTGGRGPRRQAAAAEPGGRAEAAIRRETGGAGAERRMPARSGDRGAARRTDVARSACAARGDVRRRGVPGSRCSRSARPPPVVLPADARMRRGRGRRRRRPDRRHRGGGEPSRPAAVGAGHRPALGRRRRDPAFGRRGWSPTWPGGSSPSHSVQEQEQRIALLKRTATRSSSTSGGFIVLHRVADAAKAGPAGGQGWAPGPRQRHAARGGPAASRGR